MPVEVSTFQRRWRSRCGEATSCAPRASRALQTGSRAATSCTPAGDYGAVTELGFTQHEHLCDTFLIHMNGRISNYVASLSALLTDLVERRIAESNACRSLPRPTMRLMRPTHDPRTTPFVEKLDDVPASTSSCPSR